MVSAAPITSDDFTSLSNWTTVGGVSLDNTIGSPAAPSARIAFTGAAANAWMLLASPVNQVCFSTNVNVASATTDFDLFRLRTAANGAVIKVFRTAAGALGIRNDSGGTSTTSATQLGTGWHNVELCGTVGAATTWTLYRDGAVVVNNWAANTGTTAVGRVQIGDTATAKTFTANYDHVVVDQAPCDEG
ncbi:MAG: hypothetical protein HZB15_07650, partial [Actinobacteria bacterium]|nr:hypothetical protein [Actinomycetota bacterium]